MSDIARFGVQSADAKTFEEMYADSVTDALRGTAKDSFEAAAILAKAAPSKLEPQNGARYPRGPLGNSLKQIAQLIRADVGVEVAFTDVGGWDTHAGQGGSEGQLANNLRNFAEAIAGFTRDLGSRMSDVVLVTMSEFGRTVRENGNRGTDHGHATVMLALGGGIRGGRVFGKWPGLASEQLFENRDLAITTDFRDVFAELLTRQMGVTSLARVFPGHDTSPKRWLNLMEPSSPA